ncbi:tetratricopeptide repeat protein [Streptomyces pinistramenti]|uniref:tetratricopeptide repeat protein n=1 Tax=Streptomyces pinistramenti TaxID=2884812 RepID=UPI001D097A19|nr:tetratricopeptide repeat protein [Streptomyces pinistramenti]MCB5909660.1 tetratricopeptide repeat protein [Streptomyces pinistramenti]
MDISVLGPVRVVRDDASQEQNATKVMALLALLLVSPGLHATHEHVKKCLWVSGGPEPARVRKLVSRLRGWIPGVEVHSNLRNACAISVRSDLVDYLRFKQQVELARHQSGLDRLETLRCALAEWQLGGPLQGLSGPGFEEERCRLREEWQGAALSYLDGLIEAGLCDRAISDSESLLKHSPGNQDILVRKLRSLPSSFPKSRLESDFRKWKKEHGRPGVLLESTFRSSLERLGKGAGRPIPRLLPRAPDDLIGRSHEIMAMREILEDPDGCGVLLVLHGTAGVGKSKLALLLAKETEEQFPDGALYADLDGFTNEQRVPRSPADVLDDFLDALRVRPSRDTLESKVYSYRHELANRSVLVVLDNVRNAKQMEPLLPGSDSCATIVTSRNDLRDFDLRETARLVRIEPLARDDAKLVLRKALKDTDWYTYVGRLGEMADLCCRLPLALTVLARRLGTRTGAGVNALYEELRADHSRLRALGPDNEQLSMRLALDCSYRGISAEARLLLWQLAIFPARSIEWETLLDIGLAGNERETVGRAADELVSASLLEIQLGRYIMHDLIGLHARERGSADPEIEEKTVRRAFEHVLHNVWACDRLLDSGRRLPIGDPGDTVVVGQSGHWKAMAWLDENYEMVRETIRWSVDRRENRYTWLISAALVTYQWRRNRYANAVENLVMAREAADRVTEDPGQYATLERLLGGCHWNLDEGQSALARLNRALSFIKKTNGADPLGHGRTLRQLALVEKLTRNHEQAAVHYEQALTIFRRLGDALGTAGVLSGLGSLSYAKGDYAQALRVSTEALHLFESIPDDNACASVWGHLGDIHLALGNPQQAVSAYNKSIALYRSMDYRHREADRLNHLAEALSHLGETQRASDARQRAGHLMDIAQVTDVVRAPEPGGTEGR